MFSMEAGSAIERPHHEAARQDMANDYSLPLSKHKLHTQTPEPAGSGPVPKNQI